MKLQARTIQILKNFAMINPSLQFRKGHLQATVHPMKALLASAAIEEEIPADFAIYELSKFIGTLSLFQDPMIDVKQKHLTISENGQKVNYTFADPENIVFPTSPTMKMPSEDVKFTLNEAALSQLMKASGVLGLPHITVHGDGTTVFIGADKCQDKSADKYMVEVGLSPLEFKMAFLSENFRVLPGTYNVTLTKKGIGHFQTKDIQYWITTEAKYNQF